ncbi:MAG: hypothetical protein ACXABY_02810 [Candidatus Thorarchaeota archaeon]|jgi:peptidoglycan hydrolase CwlO-like protein
MENNKESIEQQLGQLIHVISIKSKELKKSQDEIAKLQKKVNELNNQLYGLDAVS